MKIDIFVGSFFEAECHSGIAYNAFDENGKRLSVNVKRIKATDSLHCELKSIDFALQAMQYVKNTHANAVCVHVSNPSFVAILNNEKSLFKGYGRWISTIRRRADFLQCSVSYTWAFDEDLQTVNDLAKLASRPNSRQCLQWALSR